MDFYFLTSFINMCWQIFTILFVLYRFTSFFSMMYNFMLFVGKLFKGGLYVKDQISLYISRQRGYSYLSDDEIVNLPSNQQRQQESFFQKMYNKVTNWIFGRQNRTYIPLYETRTSYVNLDNSQVVQQENDIIENENESPADIDDRYSSPRSSRIDIEFEHLMESGDDFASMHTQTRPQLPYSKPFDVDDSNLLLHSEFLTNMLNPFNLTRTNTNQDNEQDNEEDNEEFKKELLKNSYV